MNGVTERLLSMPTLNPVGAEKPWLDGATTTEQGKGLVLAALLTRGKRYGVKLYYIGDELWSCELWGRDALHEATGPDPLAAVLAAYSALSSRDSP